MAGGNDLEEFMLHLADWGVADVLLPFILIFTIVYAILAKTNIIGKDSKSQQLVIAICVAFATIIPHSIGAYPASFNPVVFINTFTSKMGLLLVGVFMFILLLAFFGAREGDALKVRNSFFSLIFVILMNLFVYNAFPSIFRLFLNISLILSILVLIANTKGYTGYISPSLLILFLFVIWDSLVDNTFQVPGYLAWVESEFTLMMITFFGIFVIVVSYVVSEPSKKS
jgi:hypothetical protein